MDELVNDLFVKFCEKLIIFVKDRLGYDWCYVIDVIKIKIELGW